MEVIDADTMPSKYVVISSWLITATGLAFILVSLWRHNAEGAMMFGLLTIGAGAGAVASSFRMGILRLRLTLAIAFVAFVASFFDVLKLL